MLNVFITIDTEVWPRTKEWRKTGLARDLDRDVYARGLDGEYGIIYQMKALNQYGLKAVFFVESLFANVVGLEPLQRIVEAIKSYGHDVQLHIHTEWLQFLGEVDCASGNGKNIKDFTEDRQTQLVGKGIENLKTCGVQSICAFRAGNYGANFVTLNALKRNNIAIDTSYNYCNLGINCDMQMKQPLLQPQLLGGVYEFPISYFQCFPANRRHAQICACSIQELKDSLLNAWKFKWYSFVIVSHSFELMNGKRLQVNPIIKQRFESLCKYLADNADKYVTKTFSDLDVRSIPTSIASVPLKSKPASTLVRYWEQLVSRYDGLP
jgi:hypothetical protein